MTTSPRSSRKREARTKSDTTSWSARSGYDPDDTRDRIMATAEVEFAKHGIEGVSMRTLTSKAGVNLAAISYHFGTKEAVVAAIFDRRAEPITSRRLELLAACVAGPGDVPILEKVLNAYLLPMFEFAQVPGGRRFLQLRSRLIHEKDPVLRRLNAHFDPTSRIYIETLRRILPHLTETEVYWRFFLMLGTYLHIFSDDGHILDLSKGLCDASNYEEAMKQIIVMVAAGFRAPSSQQEGGDASAAPATKASARKRRDA